MACVHMIGTIVITIQRIQPIVTADSNGEIVEVPVDMSGLKLQTWQTH